MRQGVPKNCLFMEFLYLAALPMPKLNCFTCRRGWSADRSNCTLVYIWLRYLKIPCSDNQEREGLKNFGTPCIQLQIITYTTKLFYKDALKTNAPIGAWKLIFPCPFKKLCKTNRPINLSTDVLTTLGVMGKFQIVDIITSNNL